MNNVFIKDHPMMIHKLTHLRMKETSTTEFRQLVEELSTMLAYEVSEAFELQDVAIETPICPTTAQVMAQKNVVLVPILRAGLGMVHGMTNVMPNVTVAHIGLEREDDTLTIREYYRKMPSTIKNATVVITDPMLASGASASHAIGILKEVGCTDIRMVNILAAPEGIKAIHAIHPEVPIYCVAVDEHLNEHGYIVPGLGDAGDRLYGTL